MAEEHKKKKHAGHHNFKHTHIEHHSDGSHTVHHADADSPAHDVKHAVADIDGVHDSMEDHVGQPNPGEAEANQGQNGVPAEQAQAAGLPVDAQAAPPGAVPSGAGVEGE